MKKKLAIAILVCIKIFILQGPVIAQDIDYKGLPQWSWHKEDSTEYYLYTPSNLEPGKKYPVALFMHGCCGESYHATLRNAVDPPVRMWHNFGANTQSTPTYIIAPATSRGWKQHFVNLKKVMDDLITNHNADPQRIYVCGFSMGGEGTFKIIQEYPGYFAAALPMGMSFSGDSTIVKDIPIWANQGETDWYSRSLRKQVAAIRALNGYTVDTGNTWVTGVNPRYSNFKGVGHGVQWNAASTQDLTGWAFSKINDGNKYPNIFFSGAAPMKITQEGSKEPVSIFAKDPDGTISKIEVYQNKKLIASLSEQPFKTIITAAKGDNLIEAIAYDDKGKSAFATMVFKVDIRPAVTLEKIQDGRQGNYYEQRLTATGNGNLHFEPAPGIKLPRGLELFPNGTIKGVPMETGSFNISVRLTDEDNESVIKPYNLRIAAKTKNEILVTSAVTQDGLTYKISKMVLTETPWFNSKDSVLTTDIEEINFSNLGKYEGMTFIKTDMNDANKKGANFLSFTIDENAVIYVAYEKLDALHHSAFPEWLKEFTKEDGEIVAQYRYFSIFSKKVSKGKIVLPAADAKVNKVGGNYFVMIKKAG